MKLKGVEIFRVGTWSGSRKVEVTSAMLDQIIQNFADLNSKVSGFGVPIKLGHNDKVGEPAYGWATNVYRQGDTALADVDDVPPALVDQVGKRMYNSVSIELRPVVEYAGKTFTNVLSAIAFLGAEHPAVKGLKPLSEAESMFAADGEKLEFTQEINVLKFTQDEADALVLAAETRVKVAMQAALDAAVSEKDAALTELATAKAALAAFKSESEAAEFAAAIDAAVAAGKILPKSRDTYVAMSAAFAGKTDTKMVFGGKEMSAVEMFKSFLDGLPKVVKFGEDGKSASEKPEANGEKASDRVHAAAQAKQAENPKLSYEDAVKAVFAADPDLKAEYSAENA